MIERLSLAFRISRSCGILELHFVDMTDSTFRRSSESPNVFLSNHIRSECIGVRVLRYSPIWHSEIPRRIS